MSCVPYGKEPKLTLPITSLLGELNVEADEEPYVWDKAEKSKKSKSINTGNILNICQVRCWVSKIRINPRFSEV